MIRRLIILLLIVGCEGDPLQAQELDCAGECGGYVQMAMSMIFITT